MSNNDLITCQAINITKILLFSHVNELSISGVLQNIQYLSVRVDNRNHIVLKIYNLKTGAQEARYPLRPGSSISIISDLCFGRIFRPNKILYLGNTPE